MIAAIGAATIRRRLSQFQQTAIGARRDLTATTSAYSRRPSGVVTSKLVSFRSRIRSSSACAPMLGRTVLGPGVLASSTDASVSEASALRPRRPRTTRRSFITMHVSQPAPRTRSRTSASRSPSEQVGTSRRATSPALRAATFVPACGRPYEPQSFLPGDVVVHAPEPHRLEPPRGSWAEVSLVVVAVDNHRPVAVELARRALVEFLERDVDRADDVLLAELLRRQHLDELGSFLGDRPANLVAVNRSRHRPA